MSIGAIKRMSIGLKYLHVSNTYSKYQEIKTSQIMQCSDEINRQMKVENCMTSS